MTSERITFVLYLNLIMAVSLVALAICASIVARAAFDRTEKGAARTLSLMIQRAGLLQLMTVQIVVMSVLTLRIVDVIGADATVSIISGIAGYVLGNLARKEPADDKNA
jgi:hypothetical protein